MRMDHSSRLSPASSSSSSSGLIGDIDREQQRQRKLSELSDNLFQSLADWPSGFSGESLCLVVAVDPIFVNPGSNIIIF